MQLLSELVAVSHCLELWRVDCLLHGELSLKLSCLLEAKADNQTPPPTLDGRPVTFVHYDRAQLLRCEEELEKVTAFVKMAREGGRGEGEEGGGGGGGIAEESTTDLAILHAECEYALMRVRVKLASTNLPPGEPFFSSFFFKTPIGQTKKKKVNKTVNK